MPLGITLIENRGGIRICGAIGSICFMEKPLEPEKPRPMQLRSRDYLSQPARHDPASISSEVYSKKNGLFHKAILTEYRALRQQFTTSGSPPVALWGRCPARRLQAPAKAGVENCPFDRRMCRPGAASGAVCPRPRRRRGPRGYFEKVNWKSQEVTALCGE